MQSEVQLGEIKISVVRKDIKNLHLSVHPPFGDVTVSAPLRISLDAVRAYAITKLAWIKQQQLKLRNQEREPYREFLDRESHYVWGKRYLLRRVETIGAAFVELTHSELLIHVRADAGPAKVLALVESWYREEIKEFAPTLIAKWEPILGVRVGSVHVQRMKTQWGGCVPASSSIRLNTELARKPREFLEYVVVHEMVHLIEPSHNARFVALMDQHMPSWRQYRDELNRLPLMGCRNSKEKSL